MGTDSFPGCEVSMLKRHPEPSPLSFFWSGVVGRRAYHLLRFTIWGLRSRNKVNKNVKLLEQFYVPLWESVKSINSVEMVTPMKILEERNFPSSGVLLCWSLEYLHIQEQSAFPYSYTLRHLLHWPLLGWNLAVFAKIGQFHQYIYILFSGRKNLQNCSVTSCISLFVFSFSQLYLPC